jgi:hypothetical protein
MNLSFWIFQPLVLPYYLGIYLAVLYKTTMFHLVALMIKRASWFKVCMFFKDWVLSHLNVIEPCFGKGSKQDDNANFRKLNPHVLIHEFSIKNVIIYA